ncbi:MAG TPA: oligosaccharide flippase family protein [Bacteroidota bacterium]|nr:oligosaccharide flippase family protein [Bacteroidota bacterium]
MNIRTTFKDIIAGVLRSRTLADTAWLGSSTVMNGVLGAVISGIYARSLGVSDFGTFTLVISFLTLMTSLSDLGLSSTIVRFGTERLALDDRGGLTTVLSLSLQFKVFLTLIILVLGTVFLDPLIRLLFGHVNAELPHYFMLSLGAFVLSSAAAFYTPVYQVFGQFRRQAILSLLPAVTKLALVWGILALAGIVTVSQAIWFEAIGSLVLLAASGVFSPQKRFAWRRLDSAVRRSIFSFNKWLSLYSLISLVGGRSDIYFVAGLLDARALGVYGGANKIASVLTVVANSYLSVLLRDLSGAVTRQALRRKQMQSWMVVVLIVAAIGLAALLAPAIVWIIYGPRFSETAVLFRIMCAGVALYVIGFPLFASFYAFNKSSAYPLVSMVGLAGLLLGNARLVPIFGVYGAAYAFVLSNAVSLITVLVYYGLRRERLATDRFGPGADQRE